MLNFETTMLPTTLIQIEFGVIVRVNYQLPLISGHYIKSKEPTGQNLDT